jgi:hypothetical protein
MKTTLIKILFFSLFLGLLISCSDDDNSSTEPEAGSYDPALVGTWQLTRILSPIVTTPEIIGLSLTAVFEDDGTITFTTIDSEGPAVDTGTWSTSGGNLTIKLEGEDAATSPYSIDGNTASISAYPIEYEGTPILASLEFTKI